MTGERIDALRRALADLIAESEQVLAGWNLTFRQSLDTEIDAIPGWTSTAEFLEIANEKSQRRVAHLDRNSAADSARRSPLRRRICSGWSSAATTTSTP
ncbi:MAG: hypothetical protein U0521_15520 [Anaerolineae bacterium]